ncbi:Pentatricopeptide repeat [Macleaya cordata]|uniref:Pentatricopeptide repeat n=1 Tax=Macleaya cordata TaxID=56857 RepID=A0A200RCQ9_MACCD|nr:Pentatricopeptide repeat [Macleaya cordata]
MSSPSTVRHSHFVQTTIGTREKQHLDSTTESYLELLISRVRVRNNEDEVLQSLLQDRSCCSIYLSSYLVERLLQRFEDDWKSALGFFRWAGTRTDYAHTPEAYDKVVDILGKSKQMERMCLLVEEMRERNYVTLKTIAKLMRRLAGAGRYKDAIKMFDDLGTFGLEKDTESMNLLLDTLCKEKRVELAREVFLELKKHISPNAHSFNIFIHGWCKFNRVDEAHWTIQEMKGHGCRPCVISYSTIIQAYCNQSNFRKVYELLDEMQIQGCPPNVVTYTTLMHSLAKSEEFEEALQIYERMKLVGCKPDTLFYNSLIHVLGRAGRLKDAAHVFEVEMPMNNIAPNSSTYNTMISMFCHHSQEQNALNVLKEMEKSTFCKPDLQTYNPLLKLCFRTGKTDSNLSTLLDDMINKHYLGLDLSTSTLLIHGLSRANKCERAYTIFEEMIRQEITPRYQTCRLLLDEVKQKNMYDVADKIEDVMKQMKKSN